MMMLFGLGLQFAGEELQLVQQSGSTEEAQMICSNHEECAARAESIKMCKGFVAREPVKGHMASSIPTTIIPSWMQKIGRCCRK